MPSLRLPLRAFSTVLTGEGAELSHDVAVVGSMTSDTQLELFTLYNEDQLFTAAIQLMRRIYDQVVIGGEDAVHGDLPSAIDDLALGPWREVDQPLVGDWPYGLECRYLSWLLRRLEEVSSAEAVISARSLLRPGGLMFWARG